MKACVVVGGGIAGMSAAILLAQQGRRVTLVEKSPRPGPLLRGFSRGGLHFETGFHFAGGLEKGGALRNWIRTLGLDLNLDARLNGTEIVLTRHGTYTLPYGEEELAAWCAANFASSRQGMERFLRACDETQNRSPYMSARAQASFPLLSQNNECLTAYLEKLGLDEELKRILTARCMLYGVSPHDALRDDFFLVTGAYLRSCGTIPGGGSAIVAAYEKALARLGVEIVCGQAATRLVMDDAGRRIRALLLEDGRALEAGTVIFTGHPRQLETLVPEGVLRPAYFRHLSLLRETGSPVILYGRADHSLPPSRVWYIVPEDGRFAGVEEREPTFCVMTGPELEDGQKTCMVMSISKQHGEWNADGPDSPDSPDNPSDHARWKECARRKLESALEERLPFFKGHWTCLELSTARAMRRWIYGSSGSFYGCAHTGDMLPLPPATRVGGLFLAGQNILLPGMLGCIVSAAIAASFATDAGAILNRFRSCAEEL